MLRWLLLAASLWLLLLAALPAAHAQTVPGQADDQPLTMANTGEWWLDVESAFDANHVAALPQTHWQPLASMGNAPLRAGQTLWVRFAVPPTQQAELRYLKVPYSSVDRVTLYARDALGQWVPRQTAGDLVPVSQWPVPHRYPLLPVATSADSATLYLLRVQNMHGFSVPLEFAAESQVNRADQRVALVLGAFFGLAGLACVISLLSAVSLRDSTYALYAVSVLLMALTQAAMTGMAGLHLWPDAPVWNDRAPFTLSTLGVGVMMLTLAGIVSTRERSPAVYRVVLALFGISVVAGLAMAFSTQPWRGLVTVVCVSTCSVFTAAVMFWAWYRGDRYAPWMLLGTLPVALGAAFPVARLMGLWAGSAFTQYTMQFGIAIELPVVLVVLMLRTQQQRENVRRIHGAAHTDPSTGLVTEVVFLSRAERMAARAEKRHHASAVFVIDVFNVPELQRKFGRRAGADVPLRVATRVLSVTRDIDTVARLGDHRFGLLFEGPLARQDIETAASRILARCLMPHNKKPAEWVTRVRIAYAVLPQQRMHVERVVELLQEMLDRVPEESRKAIFVMDEGARLTS